MTTERRPPRLVVGVGASAGGLEALEQLMSALPGDSGMAFLLVQHLEPHHKSLLAELLAPRTQMSVREADHGDALEANTVYINRPESALVVRRDRIELEEIADRARHVWLPIDHLFRSIARDWGPRAVGVVLSGSGSDGSLGVRDIRSAGGLTIAQEPASSIHNGMPQSAIDTGAIDLVLEIGEMPAALDRFAKLAPRVHGDAARAGFSREAIERLAAALEDQRGIDLGTYKPATIERRVVRRMALAQVDSFDSYIALLERDSVERDKLADDLLISVTQFFRDRDAFEALRERAINPLVERAEPGATLRVWVPGCATGEEAYSIGIEFLDAIEAHDKQLGLQIFATDIDPKALSVARAAVYRASIAERVSERRLGTYFTSIEEGGYQVDPRLREVVSFAVHDLTKDPPLSRMGLVSCRNVLIYLAREAYQRVVEVLHFALEPGGYLFLGPSESAGSMRDRFSTVSKAQRIYRKTGASRPLVLRFPGSRLARDRGRGRARTRRGTEETAGPEPDGAAPDTGASARWAVLEAVVPPTIVVSENGTVLFSHGELSPYLRIPEGDRPRMELDAVLRPEIATRTRAARYRCRQHREPVTVMSSPGALENSVRISAYPAPALEEGAVIISFEEIAEEQEPTPRAEGPDRDVVVEDLERELQATRQDLRDTFDELEHSSEELRSSNDESRSINEELHAANEELEATTEELTSLNEELVTVNAELREKVQQVEQARDDLHNFFSSTKIATVFLDDLLHIERATPAAQDLLGIEPADLGRSITTLGRELLQRGLAGEVKSVLEDFTPSSCDIRTSDGRWIVRRVLPYRTESRRVEGVVVTFVDVSDLKAATEGLRMRERQQRMIARIGLQALREPELQSFMDRVVRDVQQTLDTDYCKILELQPGGEQFLLRAGVGWRPGLVGSVPVPGGPNSQGGYTMRSAEPVIVEDQATEKRFEPSSLFVEHGVVSGLSCVIKDGDHDYGVFSANTTSRRVFSLEDASFLQAVASVVGSAIGRYQARLRLALERSVSRALTESETLDEALGHVIQCFEVELKTWVGEVWWPGDNGRRLTCTQRRVTPARMRAQVDELIGDGPFEPGEGLVGRVFSEQSALWCTDLGDPDLFTRREGALKLGLVSGLGLPIRFRHEVLGVLTVFARERLFTDEYSLRSLENIGRFIGEFALRSKSEQKAQRLAAITRSAHDGILGYGYDGYITEWLPGAEHLYGYREDEMIGRSIETIVPEDRREELWRVNARIRRGEVVEPWETVRIRKDGSRVQVSVRSVALKNADGEVIGISATDRDVTRLKETERKLVEADRQKDEFIAMLGHELRNPLAAVRSASELLKVRGRDPSMRRRTQEIIERQSAHMTKLLDGLLDVSRIISGKIELEMGMVDLAGVCREVWSDIGERVSGRELDMRADLPSDPVWVEGDRVRLTQVVDNLLSNAINYTDDGGAVTLALTLENGEALLRVRDTGAGIEPKLLQSIFEAFQQADQTLERSRGGLGLGLALVKSIVELHEGQVEARSAGRGKGSEFTVRLPVSKQPFAGPRKRLERHGPLDVLLIEDNEDSAEMLQAVLELSGHHVLVAYSGQAGIEMARAHQPDLVLCDLGLPGGVSGFDVARALRADPSTRDMHLVALTGYGRPEDKARSEEAGFDGHLTKPLDRHELERIVEESPPGSI